MLYVISPSLFKTVFIATSSMHNIVIPVINSGTSVNLKKADMASPNIVMKKKKHEIHVVLISFEVVFGLLVFGL